MGSAAANVSGADVGASDIPLCRLNRALEGRWFLNQDMNCDGEFTISDVWLWFEWAFFLPGDGLLWLIMQHEHLATFLEVSAATYSGWFSGIVSAIGWLIAWGLWVIINDA